MPCQGFSEPGSGSDLASLTTRAEPDGDDFVDPGTPRLGQFAQLARTVMDEFRDTPSPRSLLFQQWLAAEEERGKVAFSARREGLRPD